MICNFVNVTAFVHSVCSSEQREKRETGRHRERQRETERERQRETERGLLYFVTDRMIPGNKESKRE